MRVAVIGLGNVGARAVRQLLAHGVDDIVVSDAARGRADEVVRQIGEAGVRSSGRPMVGADVVLLAGAARAHGEQGRAALDAGCDVVSVSDAIEDVRSLQALGDDARASGRRVVIGAGMAPGMSGLLARLAAGSFAQVEEIHIAKAGTGGPACARQHHRALSGDAVDWRDGRFVDRRGRSGRELVFFPEPIGGRDCYRAALPDAMLLAPAFEGVERVTARLSATRRDRLTALLPMMRKPHADGGPGGVRVELRGVFADGGRGTEVLSAVDHPSVAAACVAALAVTRVADDFEPGASGLGAVVDARPWMRILAERGVKAARFTAG